MEEIGKDNTWKWVAGAVGVGLLCYWMFKPKKKKQTHSNFLGSAFGKRVMFTLNNTSNVAQVVPLFNSYTNIQNPKVGITPSISEFNRTLTNEPKIVKMIEIRATGSQAQAQKPIQIYCKDASGEFKASYLYPLVSAYQVAQDMTSVFPKNLILSGVCYMNYTLNPNQTVIMTVHYDLEPEPTKETAKADKGAQEQKTTVDPQVKSQNVTQINNQPQPKYVKKISTGKVLGLVGLAIGTGVVISKMKN